MIEIPENIDSKYRFVIIAALRARQLQVGYPTTLKDTGSHKPTQLAQKEVLQNLIEFRIPEKEPPALPKKTEE